MLDFVSGKVCSLRWFHVINYVSHIRVRAKLANHSATRDAQTYLLDFGTAARDARRVGQQRDQRRVDPERFCCVGALTGDRRQLLAVWGDVDGAVTEHQHLPFESADLDFSGPSDSEQHTAKQQPIVKHRRCSAGMISAGILRQPANPKC